MKKLQCVLLVDDDDSTNFLHKKILKNADIAENVVIALNGKEAIDYLSGKNKEPGTPCLQPELILLDINMPLMDGWEFLNAYKNLNNQIDKVIIVMLTTSLNPDDKVRATAIPEISGFQTKPLSIDMINGIVEKHF
jgi:CheY-like chemotaxis protein